MSEPEAPEVPGAPPSPEPEPEPAPAPEPPRPGTFAQYLARSFCVDRGFSPGAVAEAAPLLAACTGVLTKADGVGFTMVCFVDRELDPAARFGADLATVVAAGAACARFAGTVNGVKMPVQVQIWDVGPGAPDPGLAALARRRPGKEKVVVTTFAVDTTARQVRSSARWNGRFAGRLYAERLLAAPRRSPAEMAAVSARPAPEIHALPLVTLGIMALLVAVFAAEQLFGTRPASGDLAPDISTLVAMGGMSKTLVNEGEWWRLFTCAFLHGGIIHLVLNGVALWLAGVVLESVLGRAWLLALFTIGALGGATMSYLVNDANVVSVGASGAIMGLLAAAFVSTMRLPEGAGRSHMQIMLVRVLVPSLLPLAVHSGGGSVDYGAHIGGAIVGGLAGLVLLLTWPTGALHPRFVGVARVLMVGGGALFAVGFFQVHAKYPKWADEAKSVALADEMLPEDQLQALSEADLTERLDGLVARYPRDPRLHFMKAAKLASTEKLDDAIAELKAALAEPEVLKRVYKPTLEITIRTLYAQILSYQQHAEEAAAMAAPACALLGSEPPSEELAPYCAKSR